MRVHLPELGSKDKPFIVSPNSNTGVAKVRHLALASTGACWLQLKDVYPSWRDVRLRAMGVLSMEMPGAPGLAKTLDGFLLQYGYLGGNLLFTVLNAFSSARRTICIQKGPGGIGSYIHTQQGAMAMRAFDRLMYCQCHACYHCLAFDKKLPADSLSRPCDRRRYFHEDAWLINPSYEQDSE